MRKVWQTSIVAVGVALVAAQTAPAGPAGMARNRSAAPVPTGQVQTPQAGPQAPLPSSQVSPLSNPLRYLAATFSEMPIGSKASQQPVAPPVPPGAYAAHPSVVAGPMTPQAPVGGPTPQSLISLAQDCERQGDVPQARHHYQTALRSWPGHVDVLRAAARMEDRQNDLPLAENLYRQAVAANPQHPGALNDLGLCLARQGRLEQSVQVIEQAIQIQPDKALYRNNAATVLVEVRQDQRALAHLAAVHGTAEANYNMGQLLVQRGRTTDAAPYYQAALGHDPSLERARIALAQLTGAPATPPATTSEPAPPANMPTDNPVVGPQFFPQQGQTSANQPTGAGNPAAGTSAYAPPAYQPPHAAVPPTTVPQIGQAPRYLPPVGPQPNTRR